MPECTGELLPSHKVLLLYQIHAVLDPPIPVHGHFHVDTKPMRLNEERSVMSQFEFENHKKIDHTLTVHISHEKLIDDCFSYRNNEPKRKASCDSHVSFKKTFLSEIIYRACGFFSFFYSLENLSLYISYTFRTHKLLNLMVPNMVGL